MISTVVTSRGDDYNEPYVGILSKMFQKLQLVQNVGAWMIMGTRQYDSAGPRLQQLH